MERKSRESALDRAIVDLTNAVPGGRGKWQDADTFQVIYDNGDVLLGTDQEGSETVLASAVFKNPLRSLELTWTRGEPKPWDQVAKLKDAK